MSIEEQDHRLVAVLTPAGGTITGRADGPFAGFRLEVPAGAVDADTVVTVSADPPLLPLPDLAEGIGRAFQIEPAGLMLRKPAVLTLPVAAERRESFLAAPEECKVWMRDGEAWARREQVGADERSVTVEVDTLDTALAGVLLVPKPFKNTCGDVPNTRCMPLSCNTPDQFCLDQLPTSLKPKSLHTASGNFLYFQETQAAGGKIVRFDLDSKLVRKTNILVGFPGCGGIGDNVVARHLVGDSGGNLWNDACRFRFDGGATQGFPIPGTVTFPRHLLAVVNTPDGDLLRLAKKNTAPNEPLGSLIQRIRPTGEQLSLADVGPGPGGGSPTNVQLVTGARNDADGVYIQSGVGVIGTIEPGSSFELVAGILRIDQDGTVTEVARDEPGNRLTLGGFDGDFFFSTTQGNLLAIEGDQLFTHVLDPDRKIARGSVSGHDLHISSLTLPKSSNASIPSLQPNLQSGVVDSEGGVWALVNVLKAPVRVMYFPPEGGNPFLLPLDAQPLSLALAGNDRVVLRSLPDGATEQVFHTLRRVP